MSHSDPQITCSLRAGEVAGRDREGGRLSLTEAVFLRRDGAGLVDCVPLGVSSDETHGAGDYARERLTVALVLTHPIGERECAHVARRANDTGCTDGRSPKGPGAVLASDTLDVRVDGRVGVGGRHTASGLGRSGGLVSGLVSGLVRGLVSRRGQSGTRLVSGGGPCPEAGTGVGRRFGRAIGPGIVVCASTRMGRSHAARRAQAPSPGDLVLF